MGAKDTMNMFFASMQSQSMGGYGSKILSTPMGPFKWDENLEMWVNTNNGMVMNNISFQDMFAMMDYNTLSGDNSITDYGVYGSKLASQFLYDAISGTDSVDFVTIGDSNAGYGLPNGNGGYQVGFDYAFALQTTVYATPLFFTNRTGAGTQLDSTNKPIPAGISLGIPGNNTNPGGGTYDLLSRSTDADITVLKNTIGFTAPSGLELKPIGDTYDSVVVNSGKTYTSAANSNYISLIPGSTYAPATQGITYEYRMVYGVFTGGSTGSFKLLATKDSVFNQQAVSSSPISTYAGAGKTAGFTAASLTTYVLHGSTGNRLWFNFDGFNDTNRLITGPFAALWHSVSMKRKGYCVSNYLYYGGRTTANIATILSNSNLNTTNGGLLGSFLAEASNRQISAGGSGRVIVWVNSGINGPDSVNSWQSNSDTIISAITTAFTAAGGSATNLAIILSVTHPQYTDTSLENTLASIRSSANSWVNSYSSQNVTVVDLSKMYTASDLFNLSYYYANTTNEQHLSLSGYQNMSNKILTKLLQYR